MIKVGQIGLNFGLKTHIPSFKNDKRFKITSVCSRNLLKAKKVSVESNIPHYTNNPRELFSKVDAVAFAIPPSEQSIWLPEAIKNGLHVFFEKPLGYMTTQSNLVKSTQALMVNFEFMEIDLWKKLDEYIKNDILGEIYHCEVLWNVETYSVSQNISSWKTDIKKNGGTLKNFGSHVFYYLEELFGKIISISASSKPNIDLTDQTIYLIVEFLSGQIGSVAISTNTYNGSGHSLEITGSKGSAVLKNVSKSTVSDFELKIDLKDGESNIYNSEWTKQNIEDDRIFAVSKLVNKFGDWIQNEETQIPNINSAIRVEHLMNKAIESIKAKKTIIVKK
jgi:predicted dehydrogenase